MNKEERNLWWHMRWYDLWHYVPVFRDIRDLYYKIKCRFFRRYDLIRTNLPKTHWIDKDTIMLHGMMELLVDYVEGEKALETIHWEGDPLHSHAAKEIREIYEWWKNYPNREKEIDEQLTKWSNEFDKRPAEGIADRLNCTPSNNENIESEKLRTMEDELGQEEQDMLHRLVGIRKFMWT